MVETCSTPVTPGPSQKELKSSCPGSNGRSCHLVLTHRESLAACSFYQFPLCYQQVVNKTSAGLWGCGRLRASSDGHAGPGGAHGHRPGQGTRPSTHVLLAWPRARQGTVCSLGITPRKSAAVWCELALIFLAASRERNRIKTKWRNSSFQKEKWKRRERVQLEIELNVAVHSWSCSEGIQNWTGVFLVRSTPAQDGELWNGGSELCFVAPPPTPACDGDQSTQANFSEAVNNFWAIWFGNFQIQAASTGFCWWFRVGRALNKQTTPAAAAQTSQLRTSEVSGSQVLFPLQKMLTFVFVCFFIHKITILQPIAYTW